MKRGPKLTLVPGESKQADSPRQQGPKPGVYIEEIAPAGEHWYKIVMPSGKIGTVHFPDELCDEGTEERLWKLFDRRAHTTKLKLQ